MRVQITDQLDDGNDADDSIRRRLNDDGPPPRSTRSAGWHDDALLHRRQKAADALTADARSAALQAAWRDYYDLGDDDAGSEPNKEKKTMDGAERKDAQQKFIDFQTRLYDDRVDSFTASYMAADEARSLGLIKDGTPWKPPTVADMERRAKEDPAKGKVGVAGHIARAQAGFYARGAR